MWSIKVYNDGRLIRIRFYRDRESAMKALFEEIEGHKISHAAIPESKLTVFEDRFQFRTHSSGWLIEYRVEFDNDITKLGWL